MLRRSRGAGKQGARGLDAAGPIASDALGDRAILGDRRPMSGIALLKLQRAGFTDQQVEALAEYHEAGATKDNIGDLGHKLDATRSDLEIKLDRVRSDLEFEISDLDNKLDRTRSDPELAIEKVRLDLELKIAEGKAETIRWGGRRRLCPGRDGARGAAIVPERAFLSVAADQAQNRSHSLAALT
jgi:hypothetical protein